MKCTIDVNNAPKVLLIGNETENDARAITFDLSAWVEEFGAGAAQLLIKRPGEAEAYSVLLTVEDGLAVWLPSSTDTAIAGTGEIALAYSAGTVDIRTGIIFAVIDASLATGTVPPPGLQSWVEQIGQLAQDAQDAADDAVAAKDDAQAAAAALEASVAQIQTNKENIEDLQTNDTELDRRILGAFPTDTVSGSIVSFPDGADELPIKAATIHVEPVQAGSGDPSPDNICPISGWTQANVEQRNKNLLPVINTDQTISGVTVKSSKDTGIVTVTGTRGSNGTFNIGNLTLPAGTFTLSDDGATDDVYVQIRAGDDTLAPVAGNKTFTISAETTILVRLFIRGGVAQNVTIFPMIRLASFSDSTFEPYTPRTYHVTFPTAAGTVFGAEIDLAAKKLTVDRANIASYNGETLPGKWISDRDVYSAGGTPTIGAQVVYELATPIVYELTDEQISEITTYLGNNTFWADCGNIDLTYRADPTEYISKKLAELQALVLENN